jgi:hypothetical protein
MYYTLKATRNMEKQLQRTSPQPGHRHGDWQYHWFGRVQKVTPMAAELHSRAGAGGLDTGWHCESLWCLVQC